MQQEKLLSVIPTILNTHGTSLPGCMESIESPLPTRASWLRSPIKIPQKLTNPLSFLSGIADLAIRVEDLANMTEKEISITTTKLRNLVTNSQMMIPISMVIIRPSARAIPAM